MHRKRNNEYHPDFVSPPGRTLQETLESLEMSQAELAERTGRPKKTINEIVKGKAAITPDTALQFERALGIPAGFWNKREYHYREVLAKLEERRRLEAHLAWLEKLPVRDMIGQGWIRKHRDRVHQIQEILSFFGVASPECWNGFWMGPRFAFRQSQAFRNDPGLLAGWLRMGEIAARRIRCKPFNAKRFEKALKDMRALTTRPPSELPSALRRRCSESGVALVLLPEPPRLSISGATRWLTHQKAVIQISLRYNTDDQFWLTFYHEAGHILLHSKRDIFLEDNGNEGGKEAEADQFAYSMLAPPEAMREFAGRGRWGQEFLRAFASAIGIAPGVLVGLLQQMGLLPHNLHNGLKRLFKLQPD